MNNNNRSFPLEDEDAEEGYYSHTFLESITSIPNSLLGGTNEDEQGTLLFTSERDGAPAKDNNKVSTHSIDLEQRAKRFAQLVIQWNKGEKHQENIAQLLALGQLVHNARQRQNLTRRELSELCSLDTETIFSLEKALLQPHEVKTVFDKIAPVLDIDMDEIGRVLLYIDTNK